MKRSFPLVLIQVKSAAKRTVFGPEKQARKGFFYRLKRNSFHIQVVRYAASAKNRGEETIKTPSPLKKGITMKKETLKAVVRHRCM